MCTINGTSEYALDFCIGKTIHGMAIFIMYDHDHNQAALEAHELGPAKPIIWEMKQHFLMGPAVWEIEEV